jgi:hypothetical protein
LLKGFLFDDTGVCHNHEYSSGVFRVGTEVFEHIEGSVKTFRDVVTMSHVFSILNGLEEASFLSMSFEAGNNSGFSGVSNNSDSNILVFLVKFGDHSLSRSQHTPPVFFDTSSRVQKNNNFDWACYIWYGTNIIATSAGTVSQIKTTGGPDCSDLVVGEGLSRDR